MLTDSEYMHVRGECSISFETINQTAYQDFSWDAFSEILTINESFQQINKRKRLAKIVTFGCQMNENDSEKIMGMLIEMGYAQFDDRIETQVETPDILILNTCCVRENAEKKLFGILGSYKRYKRMNPNCVIVVCGCMMQEAHAVSEIKKKYRFVDIVFGTKNLWEFPALLLRVLMEKGQQFSVEDAGTNSRITEGFPMQRKQPPLALVSIMYGCNNFCSYCIVPYVRGRERSRLPEKIEQEIKELVQNGYKEITLLGQNVNSYGKDLSDEHTDFSDLLRRVSNIEGVERIRFMTSHPKDLSDKLIYAVRDIDKVCKHIHLPVQSGSSAILKKMNRHYTKEDYLRLVDKIRAEIPDITLTTDIINGFPGETEEDFLETQDLITRVRFDMAFTFLYSKRKGTPAAEYPDQVEEVVVKDRFDRLLARQNQISLEINQTYRNKTVEVLCEGYSKSSRDKFTGRTSGGKIVNFTAKNVQPGQLVSVKIDDVQTWSLLGKEVHQEV